MRSVLLFLIPAITFPNIAVLGSERLDLESKYSSIAADPGLFHYGKMRTALNKGEIFLARSHARARIPYLTLTAGPGNYHTYHASASQITSADKITFGLNLNQAEKQTQTITLEKRLIEAGDDARVDRIPLSENFSHEIERVLKENEDRLKAIEPVD